MRRLPLTLALCDKLIEMNFAYLDIENRFSLEVTAKKLSQALAIDFEPETSGKYEEFPAYIAVTDDYYFALLGFPESENDLRDENEIDNTYYDLQISPRNTQQPSSTEFSYIINKSGLLTCKIAT
ncbi:hypothetical protein [Sessilibacter sp. MAH2]